MSGQSGEGVEQWFIAVYHVKDAGGELIEVQAERFPAKSKSEAEKRAEKAAVYGRQTDTCEVATVTEDV